MAAWLTGQPGDNTGMLNSTMPLVHLCGWNCRTDQTAVNTVRQKNIRLFPSFTIGFGYGERTRQMVAFQKNAQLYFEKARVMAKMRIALPMK